MARAGAALIGGNFIECGTLTAGPSVTDLDTSRLADCINMPLQRLALIDGSPGSVPPPGG